MYVKPNKHRNQKRDSGYFYIILSALAAVFVIAALVSLPSLLVPTGAQTDPETSSNLLSSPSTDGKVPSLTDPPIVTAPPVTDTLPFDTGTDTLPPETKAPDTDPPVTDIPLSPTGGPVLGETEDAGQSYLDKITFIGDSTTYSLLYYGVLAGGTETKQVWTPASRTLTLDQATTTTILYPDTGDQITIKDAIARKKPEIVIVTLGINGISYMYNQKEYFISVYTKLVRQIQEASPDTKIILQSIFPVATNWEKESINNERIRTGNTWVREVAEATGASYLDTISVLAVADGGFLPIEYQNGDGLHLNPSALDIVLNYIRTHALPGYANPVSDTE